MSDYWFFLSYARRNDLSFNSPEDEGKDKKLIRRFYEDLAKEVISRAQTGGATTVEQIGFFDQTGIEAGDKWDDRLADALCLTRVMICLFSRNYFNSEYCGKEFQVFLSRVKSHAKTKSIQQLPLIIPVLWHSQAELPSSLPQLAADLQYTHDDFGKLYAAEGLEYLMRLKKYEDEYTEFLIELSKRLIKVAEAHQMLPLAKCPSIKEVNSAFHPTTAAPPAAAGAEAEDDLNNSGPGSAHFVFVAGQRQELQGVRTQLAAYGKESSLWKPYIPDIDEQVWWFTQRVATDEKLQHKVLPLTPQLVDKLEKADDSNSIVVLVVDPWSLLVQSYYDQMKVYDKRNLVSCAVLVVWNEKEQESSVSSDALHLKVKDTFRNNLTNNNMYIRPAISSESELRNELSAAIIEIRRRLGERAKLFRQVDDAGFSTVPTVAAVPKGGTQ